MMFRIPKDKQSPSGWKSVSAILSEGVGYSTLPCAKLRAIVEAAREISLLFGNEHQDDDEDDGGDTVSPSDATHDSHEKKQRSMEKRAANTTKKKKKKKRDLGADDFLPIFIYCVVRAEMERPSALCELTTPRVVSLSLEQSFIYIFIRTVSLFRCMSHGFWSILTHTISVFPPASPNRRVATDSLRPNKPNRGDWLLSSNL